MIINKLCYVLAPKQYLKSQNDKDMTNNLLGCILCHLINIISINFTFGELLQIYFLFSIIYHTIIRTCINYMIPHSYIFHKGMHFLECAMPFFLHVPKCKIVCIHFHNTILISHSSMIINKPCYVLAPKQYIKSQNNKDMTKNLLGCILCHLISTISINFTFGELLQIYFLFSMIYHAIFNTCIN